MEAVEVTARFDPQGEITPLTIIKDHKEIPISGIGRRWSDARGVHILVMVPGEQIYDLFFASSENRWYLGHPGQERKWA
jgi:hypothetical protein